MIYCRVSTKEQVDEGNSLVTQEKLCKEYALKHGYEVAEVFVEQGESAKTTNRPELQRLLKYCAVGKNQIAAVIAYKIDRISRNTDGYSQIRILLKRYNVEIKSTSEHFENTPAGRFMENIIANVAQFDNDVRTERSVGGLKEATREGRYVWKAPLGYTNTKVLGKSNIAFNEFASVVKKAFEEVAKNVEHTETIRKRLSNCGLVNKSGKPISKTHFYRLLRNKVYVGWIEKFGEQHRGVYEPLISDELFHQVQRVLKRKTNNITAYLVNNPDFPLRRFTKHPSGLSLTGCWSSGRRKKYAYYRYTTLPNADYPKHIVEQKFVEFLNTFALSDSDYDLLKQRMFEQFGKQTNQQSKYKEELTKQLKELEAMQTDLYRKSYKGIISESVLKTQLEILESEQDNVKTSIYQISTPNIDVNRTIPFLKEYLINPGNIWLKSPYSLKLLLQRFEFPLGVQFDGEKFRTLKTCNIFKAKKFFFAEKLPMVPRRFKTSNSPDTINSPPSFKTEENNHTHQAENGESFLPKLNNDLTEFYKTITGTTTSPDTDDP